MGTNYDAQWRIALGLGAVPMVIAFYFRWKMHETSWKNESSKVVISSSSAPTSSTNNIQTKGLLAWNVQYMIDAACYVGNIIMVNAT
jgi:hypothetical protein